MPLSRVHMHYVHNIAIGLVLLVTVLTLVIASSNIGYANNFNNIELNESNRTMVMMVAYDECLRVLDSLFAIRLEPVATVYSDGGYIINIYFWQRTSPVKDVEEYIANLRVFHYPAAALLKLSYHLCGGGKVWDFGREVKMLAEKGIISVDDRTRSVAEKLTKYSRWLFFCSKRGVLIVGVDKDRINVVLSLIRDYVNKVFSRVPASWLKPNRVVVCGLDRNPAGNLSLDVYQRIDELLRKEYTNLGLKLVSIECRGRKSFLLGENPFTGRPLIPVMSKYYDEVVRGNRSIVRAIGLAVADVLRKVNYPARIVDVEVWPEGELTCRLDVGSAPDILVVEQPPMQAREKPVSEQAGAEARAGDGGTGTHADTDELPVTAGPSGLNEGSSSSPKTKTMGVVHSYNTGTSSWHGTASSKAAKGDNMAGKVGTILLAGTLLAAGIIVAVALSRSKAV